MYELKTIQAMLILLCFVYSLHREERAIKQAVINASADKLRIF